MFKFFEFAWPGVWVDEHSEVMYAMASKITFICQMDFNAFPVDIQVPDVVKLYFLTFLNKYF